MATDQEIVEQLQRRLENWNPDGICQVHDRRNEYDNQGRLIVLHLCGLKLSEVPSEVWQCSALQRLYLSFNQLRTLPVEARNLSSLQILFLSNNQLRALPMEVGQLSSLRWLNLISNQLTTLPVEMGQLTTLQRLELAYNPLQTPPPEIIAQGTPAILAYLRTLQLAQVERFEAKVILVGEGETGKTSLLRTLRQEPFTLGLPATHGIEVDTLRVPHPTRRGTEITFYTWDFGGQEILQATHQFFLTRRSVYLLVWDARRGADNCRISFWLETIIAHAPDAKVVLVATHTDTDLTSTPFLDLASYQQRYPQIVGLCAVSNKTGEGVAALKESLAAVTAQTPFVGESWPQIWVEAEQALLARPEHHLDQATFAAVCAQYQIKEEPERNTFGGYLHDLGKLLYFQDDLVLSTLIVLKPNWITKAISRVLEDQEVRKAEGVLDHRDLARIWATDEQGQLYPRTLYPIFMRMMERFELCYQLDPARPGQPFSQSLIPLLLPEQPPAELPSVPAEPAVGELLLKLRYTLSFVPAGLMSWLLVRTHRYSQRQHWRKGTRLVHAGQQAHLELHAEQREITLTVWGPFPYTFCQILKDTLDDLVQLFDGLQVERWIPCPCPEQRHFPHDHDYAALERLLARGQNTIVCREGTQLDLTTLLYGLHASTVPQVISTVQQTRQLLSQQSQLSEELRDLRAIIQQGQELQLRTMLRQTQLHLKLEGEKLSKPCPGLFLLERTTRSRFHPHEWVSRGYRLRLLCQYPRGLHLVPGEEGYELRQSKEWWQVMRPWLRGMVKLLEIGVPLGKAVNEGWKLLDIGQIGPALDVFQEILADLPDIEGSDTLTEAGLEPQGQQVQQLEGAALEALHTVLKGYPSPWQGLSPVPLEDHTLVWVCDHHRQQIMAPLITI